MRKTCPAKIVTLCALAAATLAPATANAADAVAPAYVEPLSQAGNPCYAVFHQFKDGQGLSLERIGPEDVDRIRPLRYADGRSLNGRVRSVTTGPAAVLTLYDAKRFRVEMMEIGPGSRANLILPVMDSYRLRCIQPVYAPPRVYAPPPSFK